jgi:hypothetical protein
MSEDGLHGLRPDRSRCAAGLVAAYEPAAVVIIHSAGAGSENLPWGIHATGWTFCVTREGACLLRPRVQTKIFENAAAIYGIAPRSVIKAPRHLDMTRRANAKDSALGERRSCRDVREGEYGQHEDREKTR